VEQRGRAGCPPGFHTAGLPGSTPEPATNEAAPHLPEEGAAAFAPGQNGRSDARPSSLSGTFGVPARAASR
jgi:hypothetical protein